jgi:outer membrane protein assembly factor BamE
MKKIFPKLFALIFAALFIPGCGGITPYKSPMMQGTVITEDMLADLQPGLHQTQVRQLLGPDYGKHPFNPQHWEYVFTSAYTDLHQNTVKQLVIKFDDEGYLTEWQRIK